MSLKIIPLTFLLILPIGCAQFHTGRSFLSEMEHDDRSFYEPRNDFPVIAGDTGDEWETESDRRARTPASEEDRQEDRATRALKAELRALEQSQDEDSFEFYEKYKRQLATTSEKIYFLKLPPHERRDYLLGRGFIEEPKASPFTDQDRMFAVRKQNILLGMTKHDVMESWGKPQRVEVAGNPRNENERWVYQANGASKYIYFESGVVGGWE